MTLWESIPALVILCAGAGLYIWVCLRFPPALLLAVVAYSMISKSASVAYLETVEVYLVEVGMVSHMLGATVRQIFYNIFIFAIALMVIYWVISWKRPPTTRSATFGTPEYGRELRLALIVSALLLGAQVLNALLSPPYALPGFGVSRHQFWTNVRLSPLVDLLGVLVIFVPAIAGVALAYGKMANQHYFRRFSGALILAYGIYFLLTGAGFNGWLMALLFWLSSYWTALWAFGGKLYVKRVGLLLVLAVGAFLVIGYMDIAGRGISLLSGSTWDGVLYRAFALQGNVYFAADVLASEGERYSSALLLGDMATTVRAYMPPGLGDSYLYKGVNLAGSLPGNSIFVFGYWLGLAPMAAYAVLLGLIAGIYVRIIASGRFMLVLPAAYLALWTYSGYTQGSFAPFLDYKFALFVGLMFIWLLMPHGTRPNRRPTRAYRSNRAIARS